MAQSLPTARQGLGEPQQKGARVLAPRINPPHAQKTLQSGLNSPDRLSATEVSHIRKRVISTTQFGISTKRSGLIPIFTTPFTTEASHTIAMAIMNVPFGITIRRSA